MTPGAMQLMLMRLKEEGVDVSPADGLKGAALEAWLDDAEERWFQGLYADFIAGAVGSRQAAAPGGTE